MPGCGVRHSLFIVVLSYNCNTVVLHILAMSPYKTVSSLFTYFIFGIFKSANNYLASHLNELYY